MVPATSEFAGWKSAYGEGCGCGGNCGSSCGGKCGGDSSGHLGRNMTPPNSTLDLTEGQCGGIRERNRYQGVDFGSGEGEVPPACVAQDKDPCPDHMDIVARVAASSGCSMANTRTERDPGHEYCGLICCHEEDSWHWIYITGPVGGAKNAKGTANCNPLNAPCFPGDKVIAHYHSHPGWSTGFIPGPSDADKDWAAYYKVPLYTCRGKYGIDRVNADRSITPGWTPADTG
jgi:Fe-S-cluster containining protein